MTVVAIILYALGAVLGASMGFSVNHNGWRVVFCAVAWPLVALVSFAGMCAGYIEAKKGM